MIFPVCCSKPMPQQDTTSLKNKRNANEMPPHETFQTKEDHGTRLCRFVTVNRQTHEAIFPSHLVVFLKIFENSQRSAQLLVKMYSLLSRKDVNE